METKTSNLLEEITDNWEKEQFKLLKENIDDWSKETNDYIAIHTLIVEEQYEEAKKRLEKSLKEVVNDGHFSIGAILGLYFPKNKKRKMINEIKQQVNRIENYLETISTKK